MVKTVRSISDVGVRALRGPFPSTRGPGTLDLQTFFKQYKSSKWSSNEKITSTFILLESL